MPDGTHRYEQITVLRMVIRNKSKKYMKLTRETMERMLTCGR